MQLKTYINYRYFDLPPVRVQTSVPVLDDRNTSLPWLGERGTQDANSATGSAGDYWLEIERN